MRRHAEVTRKTSETNVSIALDIDGRGQVTVSTGYPFFDHMLTLFGYHGYFDLDIEAQGDIEIDEHHLVEDVGLVLGTAFAKALGMKGGIRRYASALVPMDEVLVACAIDISSRPFFGIEVRNAPDFERRFAECFRDFFRSFCVNAGITLHLNVVSAGGWHHLLEAIFKASAVVLDQATTIDTRRSEAPSTKGQPGETG